MLVVPADCEPVPVLGDELLQLSLILRQPCHVPHQHQVSQPGSDISEHLTAPSGHSETTGDFCHCVDRHHSDAVTPRFQLTNL